MGKKNKRLNKKRARQIRKNAEKIIGNVFAIKWS
jgi:hypothetical protein